MTRRALLVDLICNALLPWLGYEALVGPLHFSPFRALLWVTVVPLVYALAVLLRERRFSLIAALSLVSLLLSLGSALLSQDIRMLQIRESFCTALFGLLFMLSALLGKPLVWLIAREQAVEEVQQQRLRRLMESPHGRRFLYGLTWALGGLMVTEFFLKWWMIQNLPISTVLWLGPLVLKILVAGMAVLTFLAVRQLRHQLGKGV